MTKAGNTHARRVLVEGAWAYRYPAKVSRHLQLRLETQPKVIQDIAEARAHGDLSENAEYDAAKNRQGFIEGRIQELQDKLARAYIVDLSNLKPDKVVFGQR
jgi:transcription elongation GreA/GreB family factor